MKKVILLFGPTGVSKSKLSLELAKDIGEIISADSMQIYKDMDIGTAKVSKEEQAIVPHHLIDIVEPNQDFSAADFRTACIQAIEEISQRGKLPFVVGGTGFYFKALIDGLFDSPPKDEAVRQNLMKQAEEKGADFLYEQLKQFDPERADQLHSNDLKRIARALEVYELTGKPMTYFWQAQQKEEIYQFLKIGLTIDRQHLYERIDARCDKMIELGLVDEVTTLKDKGYGLELQSMKAIGYQHVLKYLNGDYDYDEMVRLFKRDTRRFAKRQWTFFKPIEDVHWFNPDEKVKIKQLIDDFINTND